MRIQHNIMAMNAYRNYTNNVSAMKKNLEKLSSGYKINRAGDDAAGLAISEKMRAQITGLQQAQNNAKSGINLVQTAEGALTEVHDMLNRMVKLADQSANGTYDNDVDRAQLQKEMDQLNAEIDRIADSANFNGIKLFDGSMDGTSSSTIEATTISGERTGIYVPQIDHDNNAGTDDVDAVNMGDQGWALYTHKDATGAAKTSFEARLSNYEVNGLQEGEEVTISLKLTNTNNTENEIAGATTEITVAADENGQVTGKMIADAVAKHYADESEGKVNLTNSSGVAIEYNVTSKDGTLVFEMSDKGYEDAAAAYEKEPWTDAKNWVFRGNYNIKLSTTVERTKEFADATGADDATKLTNSKDLAVGTGLYFSDADAATALVAGDLTDGAKIYDKNGNELSVAVGTNKVTISGPSTVGQGWTDNSTSETKMGTAAAGTQLADGLIGSDEGAWKRWSFKDASGIKIGDTNYVFATSDDTMKAKFDSSTKVIDLRDLVNEDGEMKDDAKLAEALHRVADAAGDNDMWSVQVSNSGAFLAIREKVTYKGDADLTTREGIEATVQLFNKAKAHTTETAATGKALTLQIGDTADSFNQLKVNIGDMHAAALGLDKIRIDDQGEAAKAIDVIRAAINKVSDVRGTLGATQNRLDHTINNLSVMTENIQDAESTIRDTDVADEMMAYTKNNILIQSAQAMLAQANQVPQGVLQLLQ